MKSSDFGISARIPAVFTFVYSADDVPVVSKKDVLDYLEHFSLLTGSLKLAATRIADHITTWSCPTRSKHNIYK